MANKFCEEVQKIERPFKHAYIVGRMMADMHMIKICIDNESYERAVNIANDCYKEVEEALAVNVL